MQLVSSPPEVLKGCKNECFTNFVSIATKTGEIGGRVLFSSLYEGSKPVLTNPGII